jgi:hypothetical protein
MVADLIFVGCFCDIPGSLHTQVAMHSFVSEKHHRTKKKNKASKQIIRFDPLVRTFPKSPWNGELMDLICASHCEAGCFKLTKLTKKKVKGGSKCWVC